jgi:hypothetical protein
MTRRILGSTCVAAMLAATVTAAQGSSQAPTQAPAQGNPQQRPADRNDPGTARSQTDQQVTLTGCVAREGATDVILTSAMTAGASANTSGGVTGSTSTAVTGSSGSAAGSATGTSGTNSTRYRLSGERDLDQYIGQRVEVVGRIEPSANTSPGTAATGGSGITAIKPPDSPTVGGGAAPSPGAPTGTGGASAGATTRSSTASLPKVTITSVRAVGGNCL